MPASASLRDPTFRGKFLLENLVWPSPTLHMLRKMTGKETGDGIRHLYRPTDVRNLKVGMYKIDESQVPPTRPPVVNCRMAKGGTGKTTVAANIATAFSFMGYKVLLIDGDPQASLTNMMGVNAAAEEVIHVGTLMMQAGTNAAGKANFESAIRRIYPDGMLDLIPADITMTQADSWLLSQMQRETVFERLISDNIEFFSRYEIIIIDSAPGTSLLSINFMVAARTQLAVCWMDRESLKAIPILASNVSEINKIYKDCASDIEIVANGYNAGYNHCKETLAILAESYKPYLNENLLPQVAAFNRQQSLPGAEAKGSLIEQDQNNPGSKSMLALAKSLLDRYKIRIGGFDESIPSLRHLGQGGEG